ncbi:biogenesis of lysosome-related organelles complex 1 subunit 2 [Biomphalaria pfeifferi]|uniref:Biogenesis of lysosome-related organelles complex 1 subunit 2 n=1 Tax=Biomphalaria pfeifferi TaxID=112525 RepID=A0AAD8B2V0_BIOPF|nr:biogenesis of lysosome-related organelles complex 1 subunit 2 [Biomphalaria pfeifferi]
MAKAVPVPQDKSLKSRSSGSRSSEETDRTPDKNKSDENEPVSQETAITPLLPQKHSRKLQNIFKEN